MNTNPAFQSLNPYKFYFSPNYTAPLPNTHHNKENVPNINSKTRYEFYFKKPFSEVQ